MINMMIDSTKSSSYNPKKKRAGEPSSSMKRDGGATIVDDVATYKVQPPLSSNVLRLRTAAQQKQQRQQQQQEQGDELPSFEERVQLLQTYFPNEIVQAYCCHNVVDANSMIIPNDELIEALQKAPQLVMKETPLERYLLVSCSSLRERWKNCCDSETKGDSSSVSGRNNDLFMLSEEEQGAVLNAATKIAAHWRIRKDLFESRWLKPMIMAPSSSRASSSEGTGTPSSAKKRRNTNSGKGAVESALSQEDMDILNTGFISMLPPSADPAHGRTIFAIDRSRLGSREGQPQHEKSKVRIVFYMVHLACSTNTDVTLSKGLVHFPLPLVPGPPTLYFAENGMKIVREAFLIPRFEVHALFLPSKLTSVSSLILTVAKYFIDLYQRHQYGQDSSLHFGINDENVIHKLIDKGGFNRADIPTWIGGSGDWDMSAFQKWQKKQYRFEAKAYPDLWNQQQRRINAERSRVQRFTERDMIEGLQQEAASLQAANASARSENERLELILRYAQEEVNVIEECNCQVQQPAAADVNLMMAKDDDEAALDAFIGDDKDFRGGHEHSVSNLIPEAEELCNQSLFGDEEKDDIDSFADLFSEGTGNVPSGTLVSPVDTAPIVSFQSIISW